MHVSKVFLGKDSVESLLRFLSLGVEQAIRSKDARYITVYFVSPGIRLTFYRRFTFTSGTVAFNDSPFLLGREDERVASDTVCVKRMSTWKSKARNREFPYPRRHSSRYAAQEYA